MISVKKRTRKEYHNCVCVCVCVCVYACAFILRLKWIYSIDLHFFKWKVRSLKRISLRLFPLLISRKYEIGYEGSIANVAIRHLPFFFNGTRKKWGSKRSLMFAKSVLSTSLILPSPVTVTVVWDWIFPNWFSASQIYVPLSLAHKSKKKRLFTHSAPPINHVWVTVMRSVSGKYDTATSHPILGEEPHIENSNPTAVWTCSHLSFRPWAVGAETRSAWRHVEESGKESHRS